MKTQVWIKIQKAQLQRVQYPEKRWVVVVVESSSRVIEREKGRENERHREREGYRYKEKEREREREREKEEDEEDNKSHG